MNARLAATPGGHLFHVTSTAALDAPSSAEIAREQFERHGFVHCCFREQLAEIVVWWFSADDDLTVLEIDPAALTAPVLLEASPSRWYPHCYGPLDAPAVLGHHPLGVGGHLPDSLTSPPAGFQLIGTRGGVDAVVQWRGGTLSGDPAWVDAAHQAVSVGAQIALVGGITAAATLATAYESFLVLEAQSDEIVGYDGDGFFPSA